MRKNAVADRLHGALRSPDLEAFLPEDREQAGQQGGSTAIDQREVQAVTDAKAVERRLGHPERAVTIGLGMDVQHSPTLGVRQRSHTVLCREAGELGRGLAASAQDHERDLLGHRDEHAGSLAVGESARASTRPRAAAPFLRRAGLSTSSTSMVTVRSAAPLRCGAQPCQALQELAGDIERDVGARLEVRADDPDRNSPLAHPETVVERPGIDLALERVERAHGLDLLPGASTRSRRA